MGYHIDLKSISLEDYKLKLETSDVLKSRKILKESIGERFEAFKTLGIKNLYDLHQILKKKKQWDQLKKHELLTDEYLTILLRELNSFLPKPNKIAEFPGIAPEVVYKLESAEIKDTSKLYDRVLTSQSRKLLAEKTGIHLEIINELTSLTDLSRIKWGSALFARMLYNIGFISVEQVAMANASELHQKLLNINIEHVYFKGQVGLNDIRLFINAAKDLPLDIEF